jgi:hypothetical protein
MHLEDTTSRFGRQVVLVRPGLMGAGEAFSHRFAQRTSNNYVHTFDYS